MKKLFCALLAVLLLLTACTPAYDPSTEWTYGQLPVGGGGFVTGLFATCEEGIYYARTDVGGAFRYEAENGKWHSLHYWIAEDEKGFTGIDGLAVDPNNAGVIYLACAIDYFDNGRSVVMVSRDYGETFEVTDVSDLVKFHGNGMGRGNGERIVIDPKDNNHVLVGGRKGGMIETFDGGKTWSKNSFPVDTTDNGVGINGLLYNSKGELFATVSRNEDNLFVSKDNGKTWEIFEYAYEGLLPQRMKLDSKDNLYVVYADGEGPGNAGSGEVVRYNTDGTADNIRPEDVAFGDIVIHPEDDNKLFLTTTGTWRPQTNGGWGDQFFRSVDGGETWENITSKCEISNNGMPWIEGHAIHWCASLLIDPFNPNRIMVNSGNGVFSCDNIWDENPTINFDCLGLEETVAQDMVSYIGMSPVSAISDYDGFVHPDLVTPGTQHMDRIGTTRSIAVAANNPDIMVKVSDKTAETPIVTYTTDGGESWNHVSTSPTGKEAGGGVAALTADGSRLIWKPDTEMKAYYTEDFGDTWQACDGIFGDRFYIIGDPENPDYVYASGDGLLLVSSDGGKTFEEIKNFVTQINRIAVVDGSEGEFYIPMNDGLYRATDHGKTIEKLEAVATCKGVGIGRGRTDSDPAVVYIWGSTAKSEARGIYMSEDCGKTWTRINDDAHEFGGMDAFICGDMNVYGRCYMGTVGMGIVYCDKIEK